MNYCDNNHIPKMNFIKKLICDYKLTNTSELFIDCGTCLRKYYLTRISNLVVWKKNLNYNLTVLEDIKRNLNSGELGLEDIVQSLTGVVRYEKQTNIHICFSLRGALGYFDCIRSEDNKFNLLSVWWL